MNEREISTPLKNRDPWYIMDDRFHGPVWERQCDEENRFGNRNSAKQWRERNVKKTKEPGVECNAIPGLCVVCP